MMESVSCEHLLAALGDLETDKLKRFKGYLKNHYSVTSADLEKTDVPDTVDLMMKHFRPEEAVKITVDILRKMNQNLLAEQLEKKHKQETVPRTRSDFLQYSHQLNLDLNTVNKHLRLSESNRVITFTDTVQPYPDHPDRFDVLPQVLCRESVCGRCYWEIEWSGEYVFISVSYKSISRKGWSMEFGRNDQSWSLYCAPDRYSFYHNDIETEPLAHTIGLEDVGDFDVEFFISRIGVYVDHSAGTLSFYHVVSADTMSLIHTVKTTFTQPLYPGFAVYVGSSVELC